MRVLNRLALIPVVLGISFEVLSLRTNSEKCPASAWLSWPLAAIAYNKRTSDDQVEVAIASFNELLRSRGSVSKTRPDSAHQVI
ncbi:DUF1385 domain-containing protein [Bacillus sp. SL00103]